MKNWCFWIVMLERLLCPLDSKEIKPVNPKENQPWIFIGRTDAEAEAPILWSPEAKSRLTGEDPDAEKDRIAGGEGDDREWDGRMASLIQWAWVCASSGSWWWTGRPGMLQSMGSQRVGHDWVAELNWTEWLKKQQQMHYTKIEQQKGDRILLSLYIKTSNAVLLTQKVIWGEGYTAINTQSLRIN